jgi:hypothetical protein
MVVFQSHRVALAPFRVELEKKKSQSFLTAGTNNSVSPRPLRICIFSCAFCMLRRESSAIRAHECFFFFSTCPVSRLFSLLYQ